MRARVFPAVAVILSMVSLAAQELAPPRLAKKVEAVCSEEALAANVREVVKVGVQIDERGEPARLEVIETPGYGLGVKALEAVSQWRFNVDSNFFTAERSRLDATVQLTFRCQN